MENINLKKLAWIYLKTRIKYPFIKNKLSDLQPNVFFGYTDHPLDVQGTPISTMFNTISKIRRKKSKFIFRIEFKERQGNSFLFLAKAYNIFNLSSLAKWAADTLSGEESTMYKDSKFTLCTLQLDFLREDTYRLRLTEDSTVPENQTPMIVKDIQDPQLKVQFEETEAKIIIQTSKLHLNIYKNNFRIEIMDALGNLLTESSGKSKGEFPNTMDAFPLGFLKDKKYKHWFGVESFMLYPGEAIYGLGEQFGPLNKIGQSIGLWHFEGFGNTAGRTYKNIPFFLSTRKYGVFFNESRPITFWVGSREYCKNQIAIEGNLIDYYFFHGTFKEILDIYTELTGKPAVPPKYSFGVWMSRITYKSQEEVMEVARKLRELKFPCDIIHIDTGWFEKDWLCNWQFGKQNFPDPRRMFEELRRMGFRVSLWQFPYILDELDIYKEAKKKGILAKNKSPFVLLISSLAHVIDFSNPAAVTWYQEKLKHLFDLGASVIKADFGEGVEPSTQFLKYDGRQMHNLFPLLYNKAVFEITEKTFGEGIIWARSAYAGSQRYPVHWSGDNSSNFENVLCSLRGGLSLGLCGFTFWSQDTGGFIGTPTDDLYIRWTQLSIFQSHIRYHGNPPRYREPWNYEPKTQEIVRNFLSLRYQLIPYLYTESQIAAGKGLPLLRHLIIEFDDPNICNLEDQFLCGRNILVAPILTKINTRRIYIPEGIWFDYWTGEKFIGPQWITQTHELDSIPLFIRAGTILPLGPKVLCTDELTNDWILLKIYPDDKGTASYQILDKKQVVEITAKVDHAVLKVTITPEPAQVHIEIPKSISVTQILINNEAFI
ncbi:MAG: TIM-barrel domain-containing protein [Candidatus Helarchaeota archaeon]